MDIKRSDQLVSVGKVKVPGDVYDWLEKQADTANNDVMRDAIKRVLSRITVEDVVRTILREAMEAAEPGMVSEYRNSLDDDDLPF